MLSTFLGKITRRISLNRWRSKTAAKRGGGEVTLALEELSECIPAAQQVEGVLEQKELSSAINRFLASLPETERDLLVCRYWFLASIQEVSRKFRFSESKTKSLLFRIRQKLGNYLREEGFL